MVKLNVIGLNCGTSVDGVDVAHVSVESIGNSPHVSIELLSYREHPVPSHLRKRVLELCRRGASTTLEEICDLNFELGGLFADAVLASGIDLAEVDLVACHGQTLWHSPVAVQLGDGYAKGERRMSTLQMAESAVINEKTGITVVNDFRTAELARSRMGAPLAGFFEAALIRHPTKLRVSQNIGGMGNVTIIPPFSIGKSTYSAFDTGPGNVLIDAAVRILTRGPDVRQYDADGLMGAAGEAEIDQEYIKRYIASVAYFAEQPPKTTGREIFSDDMARSIVSDLQEKGLSDNGIVATVTRITAESIARAYEDFVIPEHGEIDEIYICGGGAENPNLTSFLRQRFPRSTVRKLNDATSPRSMSPEGDGGVGVGGDSLSPEGEAAADLDGFATEAKVGIPAEAKEAVMFALLGFLCVCGRSVPIASNETRAEQAIMGKITPGKNFGAVLRNALDARETKDVLGRIFVK